MTLEDYLQYIALISDIDETEFGNNRISLMTLHAAKGLEFPIVFIAGMEKDYSHWEKRNLTKMKKKKNVGFFM